MRKLTFIVISVLTLIGCSVSKGPPSQIVQKAEDCGAGDVSVTSSVAIQKWFGKHRYCAAEVDGMCNPIREKATAQWTDSTEGRVCTEARNVAQWIQKPLKDHETFRSGWK